MTLIKIIFKNTQTQRKKKTSDYRDIVKTHDTFQNFILKIFKIIQIFIIFCFPFKEGLLFTSQQFWEVEVNESKRQF